MSRTDKDLSWWLTAEWYEPSHSRHCINLVPYLKQWGPRTTIQPCDLPLEPERGSYVPWFRIQPADFDARCVWEPVYDRRGYRYRYTRPPSKRERHLEWDGPVRAQVRDLLFEARKQYLASGDVDIPEAPRNHRHASIKGWWD